MGLVNPVRSIVFESNIESNVDHDLSMSPNNRFPRPKGRGSLIFAQNSLHPRHECRGFSAQNKHQTSNGVNLSSNLVRGQLT